MLEWNDPQSLLKLDWDYSAESTAHVGEEFNLADGFTIDFDSATVADKETIRWLIKLAEADATLVTVLESLSWHTDPDVKIAVADNPRTPAQVLHKLATDDDADVRFAIAENHNVEPEILSILLADGNPYVVHRAQCTLARLQSGKVIHTEFQTGNSARQSAAQ
jgi:hypothetical protein